jgi:D-amino-acid dehydrogenase
MVPAKQASHAGAEVRVVKTDVVVLGAGIVGLSAALQLQQRGRDVVLLDRNGPGEGTSAGNAGIIERASIFPYAFPRKVSELARYALNGTPEAYYHWSALPDLVPWLARYWWHSAPNRHLVAMRGALPLIERSIAEHEPLVAAAGAQDLIRHDGWLKLFRSPDKFEAALADARRLKGFGIDFDILDRDQLRQREPNLSDDVTGGIHFLDPASVTDPLALSRAYARLFEARGGRILKGDAMTLRPAGDRWAVTAGEGDLDARDAVVALGSWSDRISSRFGYKVPLGVKRGYHMTYRPQGNAVLRHTLLDVEGGYVLAPMADGIRLTTGAEFAHRDAPPSPVQLARTEPTARRLFPLGERLQAEPWMGVRPCLPDMLPVIGPAPRHRGLWFDFGHAHHGLTLGPVSGRLLAELMTGEEPFTDPRPYAPARFG